jgi:serine/threonine protein kinase
MKELEAFEQEAYFLKELSGSSQNFLRFFGSRAKTVQIGNILKYKQEILMEYVEKSLKTLKLERIQAGLPFNDDEIKTIYEQLVESFNIMKNKGILHCDIKPSNVLVTDDLVIKVIDFNIARSSISDVTHVTSAFGTRDFMAPEIKKAIARGTGASIKNDKADVFSLGMTILYLLVDKFESDLNDESNLNRLTRLIDSIKIDYIKKPLEKMLEFDYNKRASLNELARVWADTRTISRTVVS